MPVFDIVALFALSLLVEMKGIVTDFLIAGLRLNGKRCRFFLHNSGRMLFEEGFLRIRSRGHYAKIVSKGMGSSPVTDSPTSAFWDITPLGADCRPFRLGCHR